MIMSWAEEEEGGNTEEIRGAREGGRPPPLLRIVRRRRRERASKERMDAGLSRNPARIILSKNYFSKRQIYNVLTILGSSFVFLVF